MRLRACAAKWSPSRTGYPLIVRGTVGMGRVTLIAFDPTKAPFPDFKARERFWADVLQLDVARHDTKEVGRSTPPPPR